MKIIKLLLVILIIVGCKEKTFADEIVLSFPKETKMKIQEFNEDANEEGSNLIYIGSEKKEIGVKYYKSLYPEPEPIDKIEETVEKNPKYFWKNKLNFKDDLTSSFDTINDNDVEIVVKIADTIPLYKKDYYTDQIKKHQAFPIFIKNISDKTLQIPIDASTVAFYVYDDNLQQFYFLKNNNYMVCEMGTNNYPYFELKPNEILIYSFPHLEKGNKRKAKIVFFKASSKEFDISINEKIILNQRNTHFLQ